MRGAAVPPGWQLVPVEPTSPMVEDICAAHTHSAWPGDFGEVAQAVRREYAVQGWAAALAVAPIPPAALPPAEREDSEAPCPRCGGEGNIVVASDNGPDAHEVDDCCPHCEGHGTLDAAYRGLLKRHDTLQAQLSKVSGQLWGLKHVREAREAFLLEVGEDLARWADPIGYWKDRRARQDADAQAEHEATERDAARWRYLREQPIDAIHLGGVFIGRTPDNLVLNGEDADAAVDAAMAQRAEG